MKPFILSVSAFILGVCAVSVMAQEKTASYWVTTDAGTQVEVFPGNTSVNPSDSRAAGSISTLFGWNNYGNMGGAVYFDITVGPVNISITGFDINTGNPGNITMDVYTLVGSHVGNEINAGAWGAAVSTGTGTAAGANNPSNVTLGDPVLLVANTTYGIALVLDGSHSHYYTNGNGSNQNYSNADLSLSLGAATNVPFTGSIFTPRVWNGTIYYNAGGNVPISGWAVGIGLFLIASAMIFQYRRRAIG